MTRWTKKPSTSPQLRVRRRRRQPSPIPPPAPFPHASIRSLPRVQRPKHRPKRPRMGCSPRPARSRQLAPRRRDPFPSLRARPRARPQPRRASSRGCRRLLAPPTTRKPPNHRPRSSRPQLFLWGPLHRLIRRPTRLKKARQGPSLRRGLPAREWPALPRRKTAGRYPAGMRSSSVRSPKDSLTAGGRSQRRVAACRMSADS